MPETFLGLVLFAASVGPGYVFLRIMEKWEPRRDRTLLYEAAELIVVGAVASALAGLIVLLVGEAIGAIDSEQLVAERFTYVVREPGTCLLALLAFLLLSYGSTALIAHWLYTPSGVKPEDRKRLHPNDTVWYGAFSRDLPKGHGALARVVMRDGRVIHGALRHFSTDGPDASGIVLAPPLGGTIKIENSVTGTRLRVTSDRLILSEADIRDVFVNYVPLRDPGSGDGGQ